MKTLEFFFDISSPWTYLAFHNVQPMAASLNARIEWKPVLVGGIFNAVNPSVYAMRENPVPAKAAYMKKDLQDWARQAGLRIVMPPKVFPVNSVKAMRGCLWLARQAGRSDAMLPFATAAFEAYWAHEADVSQDAVLAGLCTSLGIDPAAFMAGVGQPIVKDELKANTDEVIRRGGFGSPTMFVGDDMYFGNDRLDLVRAALNGY